MATKKNLKLDSFIGVIRPNPNSSEQATLLQGYIGKSNVDGHIRVYFDDELNNFVEVPVKDILHCISNDKSENPLGGSRLWVKMSTVITYGDPASANRPKSSFLEGDLMQAYGDMGVGTSPFAQGQDPNIVKDKPVQAPNTFNCTWHYPSCAAHCFGAWTYHCPSYGYNCAPLGGVIRIPQGPGGNTANPTCHSIGNTACITNNPPCFSLKLGCTFTQNNTLCRPSCFRTCNFQICNWPTVNPDTKCTCILTAVCPRTSDCPIFTGAACPRVTPTCPQDVDSPGAPRARTTGYEGAFNPYNTGYYGY